MSKIKYVWYVFVTLISSWFTIEYAIGVIEVLAAIIVNGFSWFYMGFLTSSLIILVLGSLFCAYGIRGIKNYE